MKIDFKWFGGGNWMIMVNGIKIICDPVLCPVGTVHNYGFFKSKRIKPPVFLKDDLKGVNLWLFTHGHKDHCDLWNFNSIAEKSNVVSDWSAFKQLKKYGCKEIQVLNWQECTSFKFPNDIKIECQSVPAIHALNARKGKRVGNGNGYLIDLFSGDEKYSIYTTGDTLPNKETIKAIRNKSVDLVIANVGNAAVGKGLLAKIVGRITMNMSDLQLLKRQIESKTIIPIHWDAFEHYKERDIFEACISNSFQYVNRGESIRLLDDH
jgi:L-ascorbate metabolism protein UlaG (beta-lactamase superfamily)